MIKYLIIAMTLLSGFVYSIDEVAIEALGLHRMQLLNLTLEQAEVIAIENNNNINAVRELYLKAQQGRLETISKWLPQIEAISIMYALQKPSSDTGTKSSFETQLSLTQEIFSSDKYYDVKIAGLVVEQLRLLLNAAIIDVLFDVRSTYYQVILDMEMIQAAKEKVDLLAFLSKRVEDRQQIGTSIVYNVNQSKVAIANATTQYYEMIKQKKIDLDQMVNILGFTPGEIEVSFAKIELPIYEIAEIQDKLVKMQSIFNQETMALHEKIFKDEYPQTEERGMRQLYTREEMKQWEEYALKYQPNLKVYENYVQIAVKEVSKRKGDYLPTLSFNFNYGGNPSTVENLPSSRFGNQNMQWGVGIQCNWLLFDGLGRERRIREAQYYKRAKEFQYRQEMQNTYFGVRKQLFVIEESVASYLAAEANVKLAEQTVTLATDQMDIGYATIFDYQITVDGFIQAVNNKNKARYALLKAYYGLRHATGIDLAQETAGEKHGTAK